MISSINQITLNEPFCFSWAFVLSILTGTGRYKSVGHGVPAFLPLRMWKTNEIINTRDQKWTFSKVLKEEILCSFLMVCIRPNNMLYFNYTGFIPSLGKLLTAIPEKVVS